MQRDVAAIRRQFEAKIRAADEDDNGDNNGRNGSLGGSMSIHCLSLLHHHAALLLLLMLLQAGSRCAITVIMARLIVVGR